MKLKVIFLDVDGVLTYFAYNNPITVNIDIEKVLLLKEICDKTGAKVVISSSFKGQNNSHPRIYYTLIDILTSNNIEVLGDTPYIKNVIKGKFLKFVYNMLMSFPRFRNKYGTGRTAEIHKWLQEHDVESFVILDDEKFYYKKYGYTNNWIQPTFNGNGGLKREHVEQAIKILGLKETK